VTYIVRVDYRVATWQAAWVKETPPQPFVWLSIVNVLSYWRTTVEDPEGMLIQSC
jgi:hypothetical protein